MKVVNTVRDFIMQTQRTDRELNMIKQKQLTFYILMNRITANPEMCVKQLNIEYFLLLK